MGLLDRGGYCQREGTVLGVHLGHTIPMGTLLHSCVEVREPIELLFEVVSEVGGWMGVLHWGPRASRGR